MRPGRPGTTTWVAASAGLAVVAVAVTAVLTGAAPDEQVGAQSPSPEATAAGRPASAPASTRPSAGASAGASAEPSEAVPSAPPVVRTASAAVRTATTGASTASTTRPALEQLLSERAALTITVLGAVLAAEEGRATSAAEALGSSDADLERVLRPWTGGPVAGAVRRDLQAQAAASQAYASAVRDGDLPRADAARADMAAVSRRLGAVLADLTGGRIATYVPPQDAAQYRRYVDALVAGRPTEASETEQWLRARLRREGTALAAGLSAAR